MGEASFWNVISLQRVRMEKSKSLVELIRDMDIRFKNFNA